jgi:hypothetical protein
VPIQCDNLDDSSKIAKYYSSELKNRDEFDFITYVCVSDKDIQHLNACKKKRYGQSNEEHFFNRLLKSDRFKQKTLFISFNSDLELIDDGYYKFPNQINEYLNRLGSIKGCMVKRRLKKIHKNFIEEK